MEPGWSFSEFRGRVGGVFSELFSLGARPESPADHVNSLNPMNLQASTILEKTTRVLESAFDLNEGGATLSAQFIDWVALLAETKTREELNNHMEEEIECLKSAVFTIVKSKNEQKFIRELLLRLIIVETAGFSVDWAYPSFINFAEMSDRLIDRRLGYFCAYSFVRPTDEVVLLYLNSFRKDMFGDNVLRISMALHSLASLLNIEGIPAVHELLRGCLEHENSGIRKKAIMVLKRIVEIDAASVADFLPFSLKKALCDRDASVTSAALSLLHFVAKQSPDEYKDLAALVVSILKRIVEGTFSKSLNYVDVPAPWIQIKVLKILRLLGAEDRKASEYMYEIIDLTLKKADRAKQMGRAIIYECILTICKIYPNEILLEHAADYVSGFILDADHDLKYIGIKSLKEIIMIEPGFALEHQHAVVEGLENSDYTIRYEMIQLLFSMANTSNIAIIAQKLIEFLESASLYEKHIRSDIVMKLTSLCENFSPSNEWFIDTINQVFILGGLEVKQNVAYNLIILITEGNTCGEDESKDSELRVYAVNSYFAIFQANHQLSSLLMQVMCWVIGEYSFLVHKQAEAIDLMCDLMERPDAPQTWIVASLMKLVSQYGVCSEAVREIVAKFCYSEDIELQQRCAEFLHFVGARDEHGRLASQAEASAGMEQLKALLPEDSSCWDIEVDPEMLFLDDYIGHLIESGEASDKEYLTASERQDLAAQRKKDRTKKFKKIKYVYDGREVEGSVEEAPSRLSDLVVDYEKQSWKIQPTVTGTTSVWGSAGWEQFQHPQSSRPRVNLEPSKGYANPQDGPANSNSNTNSTTASSSTASERAGQGFLNTTAWGSGGHTSLASLASMQGAGLTDPNHPHYASSPRGPANGSTNNNSNNSHPGSNRNSDSRAPHSPHQMSPQSQFGNEVGNRGSSSAMRAPQNKGFQTKSEREQSRNSGFK